VKKKTAIYGALIACVPLHISVASAQGIPVVGGPTDFTEMIREVGALQAQVDAMRASHDTTVSNALHQPASSPSGASGTGQGRLYDHRSHSG
jgi:hypothetical protein